MNSAREVKRERKPRQKFVKIIKKDIIKNKMQAKLILKKNKKKVK